MSVWTLHASYDREVKTFYTVDCDVPGLVTEGDTLEHLAARAVAVIPELLEGNAHLIAPERLVPPHTLRVIFNYEHAFDVPELVAA